MKPSEEYKEGPDTPYKQECYRNLLEQLFAIYGAIRSKYPYTQKYPVYLWDLYAGPGRSKKTGELGSPLIACEVALKQSYPIRLHFYEANPHDEHLLRKHLSQSPYCEANFMVHGENNQSVWHKLRKEEPRREQMGIVYADPSNADLSGFDNIFEAFSRKYPMVDLLLNYAAASYKRKVMFADYVSLQDRLHKIGKKKWFVREPADKWQWTMLLGTNFNGLKAEEKKRWHDSSKPIGQRVFLGINYTSRQLKDMNQPSLFGDQPNGN